MVKGCGQICSDSKYIVGKSNRYQKPISINQVVKNETLVGPTFHWL